MRVEDIKVSGLASIEAPVRTFKDLRMLVEYCIKYRIPDDSELEWGTGKVFIDLGSVEGDWIECCDHIPFKEPRHYDVILLTHSQVHDEPEEVETVSDWLQQLREMREQQHQRNADWRGDGYM